MESSPQLQVSIECNVRLQSRLVTPVRYTVNNNYQSKTLYPGSSTSVQLLNHNVNTIVFNFPVAIYTTSGKRISDSTTKLMVTGCNDSYVIRDADISPYPTPISNCSNNSYLISIANQIMSRYSSESQLIRLVSALSPNQINTILCIPSIDNAYLLELAVIGQYASLTESLLNLGADPCLTTDSYGRTIYQQLSQVGRNANTLQVNQIIGLLVQYGGNTC
jgi:hypothetical protein